MNNDYCVIVVGCKKHEEIANRYFGLANIFWATSLKKTVFCTDQITDYQLLFPCQKIIEEKSDNFAARILKGLNNVQANHIVLLLDDYYFTNVIDEKKILDLIKYLKNNNYKYCKLVGMPKCFKRNKNFRGTYYIKKGTHYGVSLQPSIWEKNALISALEKCKGSSAWEVEASFSNFQTKFYDYCLTFNKNVLHYKNGVLRGKLFPYTNKILKKNKLEPLDIESISRFKTFTFMTRQKLSMHLPSWLRKIGKKIGKRAGKIYYSDD